MTRRYADWTTRLAAAIGDRARTPFAYGGFDCSLTACDLANAICDVEDVGLPWRGRYKTERGAAGAMRRYLKNDGLDVNGMPVAELLPCVAIRRARDLGFAEWPRPLFAQRGDVALVEADLPGGARGWALGTVDLTGTAVLCAGETGWQSLPLSAASTAWGIS